MKTYTALVPNKTIEQFSLINKNDDNAWLIFWEGESYTKLKTICQKWLTQEPIIKLTAYSCIKDKHYVGGIRNYANVEAIHMGTR